MRKKNKIENIDYNKLNKMREESKINQEQNPNPFLLQIPQTDKGLYKALYKFNTNSELEEYNLPLGQKENKKKGKQTLSMKSVSKQQSILKNNNNQESQQQYFNDDEILEDNEQNESELQNNKGEINYRNLVHNLFGEKSKKQVVKIQNALFVDKDVQAQLDQIQTGEQAISFFAKYNNTTPIKFIYCTLDNSSNNFRPYDLKVMHKGEDQKEYTLDDYYTISVHGIVHVYLERGKKKHDVDSSTEVVSLSEWMHESTMFNIITNIHFFKNYVKTKIFKIWIANVRKRVFNQKRQMLIRNYFLVKPTFSKHIMDINKLVFDLNQIKTVSQRTFEKSTNWELDDFKGDQKRTRQDAQTEYNLTFDKLNIMVNTVCKEVVERTYVKENEDEENIKFQNDQSKQKPMNQVRKEKEIRQYRLKLAEKDKERLDCFIRLIDYITIENLVINTQQSMQSLLDEFKREGRRGSGGQFNVQVSFHTQSLLFLPDEREITETILGILKDIVKFIRDTQRVLTFTEFEQYLKGSSAQGSIPEIEEILVNSLQYKNIVKEIQMKIQSDYDNAQKHVDLYYEKCRPISDDEQSWNEKEWLKEEHSLDSLKSLLSQCKQWNADINNYIYDTVKGIVNVVGTKIKNKLLAHMTKRQENLKSHLASLMRAKSDKTLDQIREYLEAVSKQPNVLSEFAKFIEVLLEAQSQLQNLDQNKNEIETMHQILKKLDKHPITQTDCVNLESIQNDYAILLNKVKEADEYRREQHNVMLQQLDKGTQNLQNDIANTVIQLSTGKMILEDMSSENVQNLENVVKELPAVRNQIKEINKAIERYKLKDKEYIHCQKLLNIISSNNRELIELENKYNDRKLLWSNVDKFSKNSELWLNSDFQQLNTEEVERDMKQFENNNIVLQQRLLNSDGSKDRVLQTLISNVNRISSQLPVIVALGNHDLRPRHWKTIFEQLGMQPVKKFNFSELIANGVLEKREQMEEISARASGEAAIELQVDNIKKKWMELNFIVLPYKEYKDKYTLGSVEEIMQSLDDHQVSVQTMLGTRFVSEIRGTVEEWEKKLVLISEILDEWLTCQRQWIYLENIFNADDIQKQLPQETQKFFQIDKFWKEIMQKSFKHPLVHDCCASEELLKKFVKNNQVLDEIQKQLENYLETKRRAFARFYFLSNDEIIAIISQTGKPSAVQQHLRKCFDNINRIKFGEGEDSKEIVAMISADPEAQPETVNFSKIVQILPEDKPETWLTKIENMMLVTLYDKMKVALADYPKTIEGQINRSKWLLSDYPAQCILSVDQIQWTTLLTDALILEEKGKQGSLNEALQVLLKQLNKMVEIIRTDLNTLERSLIGALAVLDVHNRDVTISMVKLGVSQINDFEWSKQLKYYWESFSRQDVVIRQTNTRFEYGYEYLGNSPRLVITMLTDRCYMTLTGALNLFFGGAPQGPAGTGKTETTKDLAKALAVNCVVFNCSGNLDYKTMGRFFSGLAQCGAWSCFDEFNRIEIDVLSVIAQQILTIQLAIRARDNTVDFEGRTIPLSNKFGVFITMNPGYAGRTELPDNLEALFRPVSMMIPDYRLIAEIILFSEGFDTSTILANKMVQLYQLSSQQLSKQKHYDFGMRAVKSVLVMAGQLRRNNPNLPENIVLIRALRDSNIPKFLSQDLPLFMGIIQDLFPGTEIPVNEYPDLEGAICNQLISHNLQVIPSFLNKIFELFETMNVRHGVMLVGFTGTGKTKVYETLGRAFKQLYDEGKIHPFYKPTIQYKLNPKSVTMNQLFGYVNVMTNEWSDGIVAKTVREAVEDQSDKRKWVIFDGPVDALWIENMNTVLDDNKMLCLSNGQRIKLSNAFTMLFEVNDLAVASPATVSRCGMVFLDEYALGWEPLLDSWSKTFTERYIDKETETVPPHIPSLINKFKQQFKENMPYIRKECKEVIPSQDINLVQSCINIIEVLYKEYKQVYPQAHILSGSDTDNLMSMIFIYSFIWSAGANLHDNPKDNSRAKFNQYFKQKILKISTGFPLDDSEVYDFYIDFQKREFKPWNDLVQEWSYDAEIPYFNILVPTSDTVKFKYILDKLVMGGNNVLFNGETGTGKSVIISDYLFQQQQANKFMSTSLNFSAQTQPRNILDIFGDKDKFAKKKKTQLGPAQANKKMVLFCDDINMPTPEEYFAQPPIELLRQVIDHDGFYDLAKLNFMNIKDVIFVGACGPPDGGRNHVTPRLFRRFNMIWIPEMPQRSLEVIFGAILKGFLSSHPQKGLDKYAAQIVRSSIEIYSKVTQDMLPTPSKSHYTFNLRDLSKIFQGILQIPYSNLPDKEILMQLWAHENQRIFYDRLVDENDRNWFITQLQKQLKDNLDMDMEADFISSLLFGDYTNSYKEYQKIEDVDALNNKFMDFLQIYNANNSNQMNLVFFRDAINHLSRIIRVLKQARGNNLLIGLGGSGRGSLTRLASSIRGYQLFSIEITKNYKDASWKEDLKKVLKLAGGKRKPGEGVVFLFSDTQIVKESFLEDLNNILNTGEVPNLMGPEDFEEIMNDIRNMKKDIPKINCDTRENILKFFVANTRDNLHIVLTFSPAGEKLRTRCREFSSIINCCTIDWFDKWPNDALRSVAIREYKLNENLGIGAFQEKLADLSVQIHNDVKNYSDKFYEQLKRKNYTTPTSYLELLKSYIEMMRQQQNILPLKIRKYTVGLQTLQDTNQEVGALQQKIKEMQPKLDQKAKENIILLEELSIKGAEAEQTEKVVSKEAEESQKIRDEVNIIKSSCEKDLAEALPALQAASKAVENIDKGAIAEMKNMGKPPVLVVTTMLAVSLLLGVKENWDDAKKLLGDMSFRQQLLTYGDKIDQIDEKRFIKFRKTYLTQEEFNYERIVGVSQACASLFQWAVAVDKFQKVKKEVGPKEKSVKEAQIKLQEVEAQLAIKQKRLKDVKEMLAELNASLEASRKESESLLKQQKLAEIQLARAEKLLSGLGNESVRWNINVGELQEDFKNLVGNILLSAAFISYLGPFTAEYRALMSDFWKDKCINEMQIPTSDQFNLIRIVSDDVQMREWQDYGLPADKLSSENGILIFNCRRWPLVIDPQNQANKWLRKLQKENNIQITKLSEPNFLKILENCIRFGQPCLIENVQEQLDPALEPVLQKQIQKKGAQYLLRIGDTDIPYNFDFKLYMTTKMPNPHYLPEVSIKVTLINFTVTPSGLEDQLLVEVVRYERIELEEKRIGLILQISQDKKQLQDLEDKILKQIGEAGSRILDDEEIITTLDASKITANTVEQRMKQAKITQAEIDTARESYRGIAKRGSILYFSIAGLANINSMYQYSLEFFIKLFIRRLDLSEKPSQLEDRLRVLLIDITSSIYKNICRGLFEVDKLLFSFIIASKIALNQGQITEKEWAFFTNGSNTQFNMQDLVMPEYLNEKIWKNCVALAKTIPTFKDIIFLLQENKNDIWRRIFEEDDPFSVPMPEDINKFSHFQILLLFYILRPAQLIPAVQIFIGHQLGQEFTESPVFDLKGSYEDSDCTQPLIFVLSPGADPIQYLLGLAKQKEMQDRLNIMSLGQGQGPIAEERIIAGRRNGDWVCLQNCHLYVSWLPKLERIQEQMVPNEVHEDFRLWLTSSPSPSFPVPILQSGIKITNEPPKGIKANLKGTYNEFKEEDYNNCTKQRQFQKLLFSLAFFHAIILERKKFGAIGWNIQYKWMNSDFQTCNQQLKIYLEEQEDVPYSCLNYIFAEVNYGGRVTDNKDTRLITALLSRYFNPQVLQTEGYLFSESDIYKSPEDLNLQSVKDYINDLPLKDQPEIFGLHQNANIVFQQNVAKNFVDTLLEVFQGGGQSSEGGETPDQIVAQIAQDIEQKFKSKAIFKYVQSAKPDSLEIFRNQELDRFNILIKVMKSSLVELQKAIKGLVVMSMQLEMMYNSFLQKKVPKLWADKAYPSLKPLSSWFDDFIQRLDFFDKWITQSTLDSYWVSALFFPQGFMTATKQIHSRNYQIPIDTLVFETYVQKYYVDDIKDKKQSVGVNIHGTFMQGARWDDSSFSIVESRKKQLFTSMPVIWLKPEEQDKYNPKDVYQAPLYKTSLRAGELSTTGESTNFVLYLDLNTKENPDHWIRRGVALLCQLDE